MKQLVSGNVLGDVRKGSTVSIKGEFCCLSF